LDAKYDFPTVVGTTVKTNENILYRHNVRAIDLTTTPLTLDSSQSIRIGQDQNNDAKLAGKIGEIILTKKVPTEWQRRQLTQYLENRWGTFAHPKLLFGSDLAAWYDANAGVYEDLGASDSVEDLDEVAFWYDISGNGNHLTGTVGKRPVFQVAAGLLGKYGVVFTAANDDWLESGSTLDIAGSAISIFAVIQMNTACNINGRILSLIGAGDDYSTVDGCQLSRYGTLDGIQFGQQNAVTRKEATSYFNKPRFVGGVLSAGVGGGSHGGFIVVDERRAGMNVDAAPAFIDNSKIWMGTPFTETAGQNFDGVIYELMIIKRRVTQEEEVRIRDYLRSKWDF
jgi:hypothetical protein